MLDTIDFTVSEHWAQFSLEHSLDICLLVTLSPQNEATVTSLHLASEANAKKASADAG